MRQRWRRQQRALPLRAVLPTAPPPAAAVAGELMVYAISDLHVDYPQNAEWVQQLGRGSPGHETVLIVAGDVSDDVALLRCAFRRQWALRPWELRPSCAMHAH